MTETPHTFEVVGRSFTIRDAIKDRKMGDAYRDASGRRIVRTLTLVYWCARLGMNWAKRVLAHELTHHVYWIRQDGGLLPKDYQHHHDLSGDGGDVDCVMSTGVTRGDFDHRDWKHAEVTPAMVAEFARNRRILLPNL